MKIRMLCVASLMATLGCSSEPVDDEVPILEDEELEWFEVEYGADDEPFVADVPARGEWLNATLPLSVTGEDSGKEGILYSISLGHYWLLKNQLPDGNYLYDWDALSGETTTDTSRLQMLATAWSQVIVYRFLQREEHLLAAYRVAKLYVGDIETAENDAGETMAHLGGALNQTAFMLFTLVELESVMQTGEFAETVEQMGRFFEHQVDPETGCIWTGISHTDCSEQHSPFAVGQGMVALERLWRHTGDPKWLDLLEKNTGYYYEFMRSEGQDTLDQYWFAWAGPPMISLLLERPNADHETWIYEMADYRTTDQYIEGVDASYIGGFKRLANRPPTWSAVSAVEGVIDAYRLAEARGDEDRMVLYRQAGILAARYLMSLQYRASNVGNWDLADPDRAIGAYHFAAHENASSISMHFIRTDYMDHFAITLTKALTFFDLPETYPGPGLAVAPDSQGE